MSGTPKSSDLEKKLQEAVEAVRSAGRVAVLTGAGVSAESGVPTFRGAGGLWEGQRIEDVATPRAFRKNPELVWRFYNMRRAARQKVQPNPGHVALANMETLYGFERFALITQNVDGLHQEAGSQRVLEVHGSLARIRCTGCTFREDRGMEPLPDLPKCEKCGALLRPDIVWFEEMLPADVWEEAEFAASSCQCFMVVGTSAIVYPAAGLIHRARDAGATIIEVNIEPSEASQIVDVGLYGPSGQILPELVSRLDWPQ
jgi:NAD-dependent deacetylase